MKVYKEIGNLSNTNLVNFHNNLVSQINEYQTNGWEVEIQYQTFANNQGAIYSALILAYTEE